jgi:HD superfamily phosphohydrolase YqeK
MTKIVNEAKAILENMLQNFSQWHTERVPSSTRKINSVEEVDSLTAKVDGIYHTCLEKMLIMFHYKILLKMILKI